MKKPCLTPRRGPERIRKQWLDAPMVIVCAIVIPSAFALAEPTHRAQPSAAKHTQASLSASSSSALPSSAPPTAGFAPDPPVVVTRRKWRYEIQYHDGIWTVPYPALINYERPIATPRKMGRFAIELYIGKELLERVRFEVPLLDGDTPQPGKRSWDAAPNFERKARVKVRVEVPDLERATYAVLVDRATGQNQRIPWPPVDGLQAPALAPSASPSAPSSAMRPLVPR